ncbi:alpha/beta hydrolase family esterase [Winogradskya humida]|uniref:Phospholipase/carboxylesterase/thioesterase domain-containing protein n=1 Tax=Winogradskya humida TaxID=113566 RepID=A0ABQ3ZSI7_9ACTN|nr:PHB depolymerase family esterase [Actinoplanes humidus]GIE21531.1 hypothetical protein Ahu01nite_046330 [Actinoplanes humidus]
MRDSVEVAGRSRTYTVVGQQNARNLVLVFHGSGQTGDKHRDFTGRSFDTLTDDGAAVVAYLDGYKHNWNDARRASSFPARKANIDDVGFVRAVIRKLTAGYGIDPGRVFAVGYSNGGQMVMRLVHEAPELIAGAAVFAATMPAPENFLVPPSTPVPMPVLLIHGTKDPIVSYEGGEMSWWARTLFKVGGRALSMPQTAHYFAGRNGITTPPTTTPQPNGTASTPPTTMPLPSGTTTPVPSRTTTPQPNGTASTTLAGTGTTSPIGTRATSAGGTDATSVERTEYRQEGRPPVVLYTVHGGGHTIPGPRKAPALIGRTNQDVSAADLVARFFGLSG